MLRLTAAALASPAGAGVARERPPPRRSSIARAVFHVEPIARHPDGRRFPLTAEGSTLRKQLQHTMRVARGPSAAPKLTRVLATVLTLVALAAPARRAAAQATGQISGTVTSTTGQ